MQVAESAKLAMIASYVYLQEGNIAEGEQRVNLAIRHALQRCAASIIRVANPEPKSSHLS